MKKLIFLFLIVGLFTPRASSQILISILFGDQLNTDKLEFGLSGGFAFTTLTNLPDAKTATNFHLGLYMDIKLSEKFYLHPEFIGISTMGTRNLQPYEIGDEELDDVLAFATIDRKLTYFNLPILLRYRALDRWYLDAGIQAGLLAVANDVFVRTYSETDDFMFRNKVTKQMNRLDFGFVGGLAYKLSKKRKKSMKLGVRYYHGIVNVVKNPTDPVVNSSIHTFFTIPIGAGPPKNEE